MGLLGMSPGGTGASQLPACCQPRELPCKGVTSQELIAKASGRMAH